MFLRLLAEAGGTPFEIVVQVQHARF
jgi:hypothetical protein